mgnify:FL=1
MSSYLKQLNILLHSDLTKDTIERFYNKALTEQDIKHKHITNLEFRIDASKLFHYPIKLHDLLNEYDEKYVIANTDDYGITYGGDRLSVNFIYIGLNQLYSTIKNEDILATYLKYKSLKHKILRTLFHLRNFKFARHRKIRFHVLDAVKDYIDADIAIDKTKKDIAKDTIQKMHIP